MKKLSSILFLCALVLSACSSLPELSPAQRREIQNRTFHGVTKESVFRAFKTVLQDEDSIIKAQEPATGLIVAVIQKTGKKGEFWSLLGKDADDYQVGDSFELCVNLYESPRKDRVESRLTIDRLERYTLGGEHGEEVLSPALYNGFYQRVTTELKRRSGASAD